MICSSTNWRTISRMACCSSVFARKGSVATAMGRRYFGRVARAAGVRGDRGHHESHWRRSPRAPMISGMASSSSSTLPALTADSFTGAVLESDQPVLVDFTAAWCGPCRVMTPILEDLAADRDDLRVVQVDVDAQPEVAARYGVLSMPTLMLFRDGTPALTLVGARPRRRLERELSELLG